MIWVLPFHMASHGMGVDCLMRLAALRSAPDLRGGVALTAPPNWASKPAKLGTGVTACFRAASVLSGRRLRTTDNPLPYIALNASKRITCTLLFIVLIAAGFWVATSLCATVAVSTATFV